MSSQPLVSVITPSFNQAAYLEQTICSVLEQDYSRLEYWVIDGGSTDGSLEIIQKYAHDLAGWVSETDRGQADAINKGFQRASGEIIAWLNSDDIYYPGAVSAAVAAFKSNPHAGLVFSDVDSIDETGKTFNRMCYGDWGLEDLMAFRIIGQAGVFMRRSAFEQVGMLDIDYHFLLDHHLWLRIGLVAALAYVPGEPWAAARFHAAAKNVALAAKFQPRIFPAYVAYTAQGLGWCTSPERVLPVGWQSTTRCAECVLEKFVTVPAGCIAGLAPYSLCVT